MLAAVYLLLAAVVWLMPDGSHRGAVVRGTLWRSLLPSAGLPASVRPTFSSLVPSITATWALGGLYLSLGSSVLADVLGVRSHLVVGLVLGAFFVAGTTSTAVSTVMSPRLGGQIGDATLVIGVSVTVLPMVVGSSAVYLVGSVVAGFGFGASFRLAVQELGAAAPVAERGQVFATMYIVSYAAFSVPALAAGLAVERFGLEPTAVTYGVVDIALVLTASVVGSSRAHRREGAPRRETG